MFVWIGFQIDTL